ncbi:Putative translation factor (SUA5) [Cesiribacter andamanensis AMV16]|uniref:Putative translation factor (SUA5) n=1 Tax=Cesiribacter andamanensis AMV16 TaxID=1279009 RepID=M7N7P0_9BACT|nr:Putative translation factor (SUA5) [Cesiribacter andamanensis AMV16]
MELEDIQQLVPKLEVMAHSSSNPVAPGQLEGHYAPRKPLLLGKLQDLIREHGKKGVGVLSFKDSYPETCQTTLSPAGDLGEAARNLFKALRLLDSLPVSLILAEEVPDYGLGRAINDRLRRASAGSRQADSQLKPETRKETP